MKQLQSKSVVVGIDGSQAAVNAAKWAVDEAISRQMPLRLVYVVARREAQSASAQTFRVGARAWRNGAFPGRRAPCRARKTGRGRNGDSLRRSCAGVDQ